MKKKLNIPFALIMLLGCNRKNDLNLKANDILSITVFSIQNNEQKVTKNIQDRKLIDEIINCMNYANKEPVKFIPLYNLVFYTHKGNFVAAINGKAMSIRKGTKYRLKCDLESLVK